MALSEKMFGQSVRLAYLEAKLFVDGEMCTTTLREFAGISRAQAGQDINVYFATYGESAKYSAKLKRYILDLRRKPKILKREELVEFLRYAEGLKNMVLRVSKSPLKCK